MCNTSNVPKPILNQSKTSSFSFYTFSSNLKPLIFYLKLIHIFLHKLIISLNININEKVYYVLKIGLFFIFIYIYIYILFENAHMKVIYYISY